MALTPRRPHRAEFVSAWMTGIGFGWIAFMVTWILANRVTARLLPLPEGPLTAMGSAIVSGIVISLWQGRRLATKVRDG